MKLEVGHIPDSCQVSAAASLLAMRKLAVWVFVPFDKKKRKVFKFDLRFRGVA